jgi:hypothetical protein
MHIGYWWESQKERDQKEVQDVGGWTILKWIVWYGMDCIDLAEYRDHWRTLANTVMNLRVL